MNNLIGAVLCGGQSKRMGTDKGMLIKDGKTWAEHIADKLKDAGLSVLVSINETQQEAYKNALPQLPLILDQLPIDGPLDGLLSIHKNFPEKDILLMACDLIDMEHETIHQLITNYEEKREFDYYVYRHEKFTQPFCAIYKGTALKKVYEEFENNSLGKYSLHERFESGKTLYISANKPESFNNYNRL